MANELTEEADHFLADFLSWCERNDLKLSEKVKVSLKGSCHRYGMIAVEDIDQGECLFQIPRSLVLQPKTSSISKIFEKFFEEDEFESERGSGWAPLLLTLMYEYTNPTSHWKPYLNLVPDVTILDQPMFWEVEERKRELQGTGVEEDVENDVQGIEEEYNTTALPFIKKYPQYFSESRHTLSLYKHMAAFVMAYSFTEQKSSPDEDDDDDEEEEEDNNAAPAMVPMADILNHISNNNAHLEFGAETLTMVATQDIPKGQEIFNTYGKLANCHLLQSYGFVEEELPNPYDMVEIPISAFIEAMKETQSQQEKGIFDSKLEFMEETGVATKDDLFLFGREGCSHFGPDLYTTLRILHLTEEKFKQLLEEQVNHERSEEFDDIGPVLDQIDDETKKDTCWRFLELVFKAECKKGRKKRKTDEKNSHMKQKKFKITGYGNADSMESVVISNKDCCNLNIQTDNGILERNKIESQIGLNNRSECDICNDVKRTSDPGKCIVERGEASDLECAGKEKILSGEDCKASGSSDISGDHVNDENHTDEDNCCRNCDSNGNDDDDDGNEEDDDDEEEEEEGDDNDEDYDDDNDDDDNDNNGHDSQEESEQSISYEMMSQWPLEWRRTLKSVAEFCVKQRYGNSIMKEATIDKNFSRRHLCALRIKQGQKSIFGRICELATDHNA